MGQNERGAVAITDASRQTGSLPGGPTVSLAPVEPLSLAAAGRWGLAIRRPRGFLRTEALLDAATGVVTGLDVPPAFLAFDVPRDDLLRPGTAESLLHQISMAGLSATVCLVQIPHEAMALADRTVTDNLRRFRAAGARLFVSGVSSRRHLPLLAQFPLDGLTLARSVTAPGREPQLLDAVRTAARAAGLATIGVADPARRHAMAAAGLDHLQHAPSP